ncbi:SCO4226 family nickel-binding protein [Streptomyces flavalbus]|uniref:SCO4226 family nickel-binding protein n=1 Tax=Streptomyces flavalbus TaxID=2665155 RepID=A0ABW2WCM0_9ACTN
MPQFMDVHHGMKGITAEQLREAHNADLAIEKEEKGVHFERAWADPESGTVYCLSAAPSADAVQRVHERAGHPADEVHPVPLSI